MQRGTQIDEAGNVLFAWKHQRLANLAGSRSAGRCCTASPPQLLASILLADPFDMHQEWWYRVAFVTSVLFAAVLVLVVPWPLPLLEYRSISRAEQMRAGTVAYPPDYAVDLAHRGLGYRHYVAEGSEPTLTRFGRRLHEAVKRAYPRR